MSRHWRRLVWHWLPALLFMAVIFSLSSIPGRRLHIPVRVSDKLIHGTFYFVLCLLIFRGLRATCNGRLFRLAPLVALMITSFYGLLDELYQSHTGRTCDVGDWLADTIGAAIAAAFLMVYTELKHDLPPECEERRG